MAYLQRYCVDWRDNKWILSALNGCINATPYYAVVGIFQISCVNETKLNIHRILYFEFADDCLQSRVFFFKKNETGVDWLFRLTYVLFANMGNEVDKALKYLPPTVFALQFLILHTNAKAFIGYLNIFFQIIHIPNI